MDASLQVSNGQLEVASQWIDVGEAGILKKRPENEWLTVSQHGDNVGAGATDTPWDIDWRLNRNQLQVKPATPARINSSRHPGRAAIDDAFTDRSGLRTDKRTPSVPTTLLFTVSVKARQLVAVYPTSVELKWMDNVSYESFCKAVDKTTRDFVKGHDPSNDRQYMPTSRACLFECTQDGIHEVDSCLWEPTLKRADLLRTMIMKFLADKPTPFFVEVKVEYDWFILSSDSKKGIKKAVNQVLIDKRRKNYDNKDYWPKKIFRPLLNKDTIRKIIHQDFVRNKDHEDCEYPKTFRQCHDFIAWLDNDRQHLLAAMIWCDMRLDCLFTLYKKKPDARTRRSLLEQDVLSTFLLPGMISSFLRSWHSMRPVDFPLHDDGNQDHDFGSSLGDDFVIPLNYDPRNDFIDNGANGNVYEVTVHGDYHAFSPNKNEKFALKVMRGMHNTPETIRKEMQQWDYLLRKRHPHIAGYYHSWTHKNQFFILMPRAEMDLGSWMRQKPFDFNTDLSWLLEQLEGITSAVQRIHHIGRDDLPFSGREEDRIDFGSHNDLKPANILVFGDRTWKITDFGTLRIRRVMSNSTSRMSPRTANPPLGDPVWGAPEMSDRRRESFSGYDSDMWSLGCIFLEILTWVFSENQSELREFQNARSNEIRSECDPNGSNSCKCREPNSVFQVEEIQPVDGEPSSSDRESEPSDSDGEEPDPISTSGKDSRHRRFWFKCRRGNQFHQKYCVGEQIDQIVARSRLKCKGLFEKLCNKVRVMLDPIPSKRPRTSRILELLGAMMVKAEGMSIEDRQSAKIWRAPRSTRYKDSHYTASRNDILVNRLIKFSRTLADGSSNQQSTGMKRKRSHSGLERDFPVVSAPTQDPTQFGPESQKAEEALRGVGDALPASDEDKSKGARQSTPAGHSISTPRDTMNHDMDIMLTTAGDDSLHGLSGETQHPKDSVILPWQQKLVSPSSIRRRHGKDQSQSRSSSSDLTMNSLD